MNQQRLWFELERVASRVRLFRFWLALAAAWLIAAGVGFALWSLRDSLGAGAGVSVLLLVLVAAILAAGGLVYLVAPGVDVISAAPGGGFQSMDGSSMATPHIAGLAALLWQAMPTATVAQIENAIYGSCSIGTMSRDRANRGLPNAVKAFQLLTGTPLPTSAPKPARPGRARKPAKKAKLRLSRISSD